MNRDPLKKAPDWTPEEWRVVGDQLFELAGGELDADDPATLELRKTRDDVEDSPEWTARCKERAARWRAMGHECRRRAVALAKEKP